jgi:N-methylhydantoinase A
MADLIRKSTIEQGHDPRDCVLVAYGGAGPTHAVFYSHEIGAKALLVPADSTVFSAEGMLTCDITHTFETSGAMGTPFSDEDLALMTQRFEALEEKVRRQFELEGAPPEEITTQRKLGVRYGKQVHAVDVDVDAGPVTQESAALVLDRFIERYSQVYGKGALLSGVSQSVEIHRAIGTRPIEPISFREHDLEGPDSSDALKGEREAHFEPIGFTATRVYDGEALRAGNVVEGPAIIERMGDSVVVPLSYQAVVDRYLTLRLSPVAAPDTGGEHLAGRMDVAR